MYIGPEAIQFNKHNAYIYVKVTGDATHKLLQQPSSKLVLHNKMTKKPVGKCQLCVRSVKQDASQNTVAEFIIVEGNERQA